MPAFEDQLVTVDEYEEYGPPSVSLSLRLGSCWTRR
eukprot:COSAG01_NODE_286_length_19421_cov_123.895663_7_plen_36_part_00